jgi:hypothetical protein
MEVKKRSEKESLSSALLRRTSNRRRSFGIV